MRRHLTIVLTEADVPELAALRHRWDPDMARGVPPHVTLVYPEEVVDEPRLLATARRVAPAVAPFELELDRFECVDGGLGGLFVSVRDPDGSWARLRSRVLTSEQHPMPVTSHLTIVHPRTSGLGAQAWASVARTTSGRRVVVREFALTETAAEMVVVERFPLGGARPAQVARKLS